MKREGPIGVLIVDASSVFGGKLAWELERHEGIRVAGVAGTAAKARQIILGCHPDVIVLDLDLRCPDGLEYLRALREHYPVPVIGCSGAAQRDCPRAMQAIELGALDVVVKPEGLDRAAIRALASELVEMVRVAVAEARPVSFTHAERDQLPISFRAAGVGPARYLVAIGASTGGPEAVRALLASAPPDFPPTVIVQHMPAMFTPSFAQRLDGSSPLDVHEATEGQVLVPGVALVARGDTHLTVRGHAGGWRAHYTNQRRVNLHCPSIDVLFDSALAAAGENTVGILLTGMGTDGAEALLRIRTHNGVTIAQESHSCAVYGMPKAALQRGAVQHVARPEEIPRLVVRLLAMRERRGWAATVGR